MTWALAPRMNSGNGRPHCGGRGVAVSRFADVLGQDKAKLILKTAFARHKTSHAYLFQGPAGVGKKMTARAFATFLNCLAPDGEDSCGKCRSCRKMASANHPDFVEIIPEIGKPQIAIDQIRELKKGLSYLPVEGGYRLVLLADIQQTMARAEVANSLLKTLEEPPARTVFVLTAIEAAGILPTIISRCQVVPFYPLPYTLVSSVLRGDGLPAEQAIAMASIAEGSIGRAKGLVKTDLLELRKRIVEGLLALSPSQPGVVEGVFALTEQAVSCKDELGDLLELLKIWIKDLLILGAGGREDSVVNRDLSHTLPLAAKRWGADQLAQRLALLGQAQRQLRHNCQRSSVFEVLFWGFIGGA